MEKERDGIMKKTDPLRNLLRWGEHLQAGREQEAAAAWTQMDEESRKSLQAGEFLPLDYLGTVFRLADFECFCVRLSLLPELDSRFKHVSPEMMIRLYDRAEDALLRYYRYFNADGSLACFFFGKSGRENGFGLNTVLKLDHRIRDFILEGQMENARLAPFVSLWEPDAQGEEASSLCDASRDDEEDGLTLSMERFLERAEDNGKGVAFLLTGPAGVGKKRQVVHFCRTLHQAVLFVDMRKILMQGAFSADLQAELRRESVIRQSVLCFDGLDALLEQGPEGEAHAVSCLEQALVLSNLVFATARREISFARDDFVDSLIPIALPIPDAARRRDLWRALAAPYALSPKVRLENLADKFMLTAGQIKGALAQSATLTLWQGAESIGEATLYESCYGQIQHELASSKARKVPAVFTWEDLILPPASKDLLRAACDQVRYQHVVYKEWGFGAKLPYGRGLSLLFSGPPGTGKTMGAQVVAGELQLELYKVDLAGVVSKYIGETEKNLREIFREAAKSQAVLFFDEADVLFNKRTEVKEANDRYNNMEAAFMLQEIEEYDGVCVLATNYIQNIDEAFKRRLKFIIEFPFPNREYRLKLWRTVFPATVPLAEELDWDFLAERFELSGSNIKNIAVNAAFAAAAKRKAVGMAELLLSLRHELAKSGKNLSPEEFGEYYILL